MSAGEGLPRERTGLAWQRTAISGTIALLAPLVVAVRLRAYPLLYAELAAALVAAALVVGVRRRLRELRSTDPVGPHSSPWPLIWHVAAVTVLAGASGLATVIVQLSR